MESISCKILQHTETGDWLENKDVSQINVLPIGITIRDITTNKLLCDFPTVSLKTVYQASVDLFRFSLVSGYSNIAVQLQDPTQADTLARQLRNAGIDFIDTRLFDLHTKHCLGIELPDLRDPTTQAFILQLLFCDEFEMFSDELHGLLCGLKAAIKIPK